MNILITGGAGFIGSNVARRTTELGWNVSIIDDFSTGHRENLNNVDAKVIEGTILDYDLLVRVLRNIDAIIHLAARPSVPRSLADPLASHHANATGTLQVLEAARNANVPYVLLASSSSVYGSNPILPKVETLLPQPMSPYAVSKLATETYALAYSQCFGLSVLPFRFFNVYGEYQRAGHAYAAVIPAFIEAALNDRPVTIFGDGHQTRDFTHVSNVVDMIISAITGQVAVEGPVNLAFGTKASLLDVLSDLEEILGRPLERNHLEARTGDVRHSQADNSRLIALFPEAVRKPLREGLTSTVQWYIEDLATTL
jgi:UDP-glucose 4-epimerase